MDRIRNRQCILSSCHPVILSSCQNRTRTRLQHPGALQFLVGQTLTIDFGRPLPLFPLPRCVLLPHAAIPLHVFEPRYRAMTRDALARDKLIAMAVFDGDDWRDNYQGNPPLRPCVCVGYIVQHQAWPDGRSNLLLHGVCRARIVRETDHTPYRTAHLRPIEMPGTMEIDLDEQRRRVELLLSDEHVRKLASVASIHRWLNDEIPTLAMLDLAAMALSRDTDDRYAMLAEPDPLRRADRLIHTLDDTRRVLELADALGPALSKDGLPLN